MSNLSTANSELRGSIREETPEPSSVSETPPNTAESSPIARRKPTEKDLAAFYNNSDNSGSHSEGSEESSDGVVLAEPSLPEDRASQNARLTRRRSSFLDIALSGSIVKKASNKFIQTLDKMDIKKEGKVSNNEKLVEAFMKSEMKKNSSYNDLAKDTRIDSGNKRNGGVSPDGSENEITMLKNPKKLAVFEGVLSDDLPPLNSKIVRIFTSSTFTGRFMGNR